MRFRQIEAFRYVMLCGTTSAAAFEMNVSQPAISRLISDLEYALGFALFDRRNGRLNPTQEATEFFSAVDESFLGLDRLTALAEQIRTKQPLQLKISCTPSLAASLLPLAMMEHKKYHPEESVIIYTDNIGPLVTKLQSNAVDIAIGLQLPGLIGVNSEPIGDARYVFAARHDHPLAAKSVIRPEDLIGETILSVISDKHPNYWNKLNDSLKGVSAQVKKTFEIDAAHTGYSLIAAGMAVAVIEPFSARIWAGSGVITRPFEPIVSYGYDLAFPNGKQHHPSVLSFAETVKKVARGMPEFAG
ncbi:DNA-binding transcriptional regulator, LysR family [Neptunomonas qingdaonensis]|uniref:DNA-binding transcriptional regulator, LysR family n=2 Tax=Neptunomonas qingdaonensis TaxID=1045558 RepID=A0A1I2QXQ1_9GAMM|nr:DNA-binding transcriptional regulator, LysR family [Neptunomonas qingdaonensis]